MKAFTEYLKELSFYEDAKRKLAAQKTILISGCADAQKAQMLCGQGADYPYKLVLTFSDVKAKELYEDYSFFDKNTILFPAKDYIFFQADIRGQEMTKERICCYRRILEKEPLTIVTTVDALLAPCLPLQMLEENCITISAESIVEEEAVAMKLVKMGYEKTYQVEEPGQFSIRGGIIDIYDLTEENPYRIELWGDEVESIRRFDVLSQRSVEALRTVTIYPATEMILTKQQKLDGLKEGDVLVLSGSIPSMISHHIYEEIMKRLEDRGVRMVVDAEKDLLLDVLPLKPFLIKPNNHELGQMFGRELKTEDEIIECAKELQDRGAVNVLVSMAGDGALLVAEDGHIYKEGVCRGTVKNSVGAGDSMVAGFLAGYLEKGDYKYALKLGTASGGATAFSYGIGTKELIMELLGQLQ